MAAAPETLSHSVRLQEEILRSGDLAFNPEQSVQNRSVNERKFNKLLSSTKTLALIPVLSTLIQPDRVPPWLRSHLVRALAVLPLRPSGVRDTIECIFAVHPSTAKKTGTGQAQNADSRGPIISLEALNAASRLISSPPSEFPADAWFSAIGPQLFALLDGQGGLELVKAASFIIGYGILGRKALGAPGTPGWMIFAEPMLSHIRPTLTSRQLQGERSQSNGNLTDVRPRKILVTDTEIADALRRLASLLSSHPNPGLSKRLLDGLVLPLWSLSSWAGKDTSQVEEQFRAPAKFLLQILLQLSSNGTHLATISRNLLYQGNRDGVEVCWTYRASSAGGVQIEKWPYQDSEEVYADVPTFELIDGKVEAFIDLLRPLSDNDDLSVLFLSLCREWLLSNSQLSKPNSLVNDNDQNDYKDLEGKIVVVKLVQKMMDTLAERLVGDSSQILDLADGVLRQAIEAGDDLDSDDTIAVALSLLNIVFMSKSFANSSQKQSIGPSLSKSLEFVALKSDAQVSITARNLLLLLQFKATEPSVTSASPLGREKDIEDRKTYSLALIYLTGAESPPPVRAQGLDLLSSLVVLNSAILDIPAMVVLLTSLLQDDEEYIYLRAIKALVLLSVKHPKAVMLSLLERYIDPNEESNLDSRLRFGESLMQVVQKAGETFSGELAMEVAGGLLVVAGRRGARPKYQAEQARRTAISRWKKEEAEEAWEGPVPQLEGDSDIGAEDHVLSQIVDGWDGKMGTEDIRIRASALSVFGSAIETNVAGLGSSMTSSAVDLSINILALESEHEKAILRRAAILLVMSLLRALDEAQEKGKKLGFGFAGGSLEEVLRILQYVSESDNDGLVRQHAKDVVEGLATWQMKSLLQGKHETRTELHGLAGLSLSAGLPIAPPTRPKIEEIE